MEIIQQTRTIITPLSRLSCLLALTQGMGPELWREYYSDEYGELERTRML